MKKPCRQRIRLTRPLTEPRVFALSPHVCVFCERAPDPTLPHEVWREHDENDRPIPGAAALVSICRSKECAKLLAAHPRLYSPANAPGAFPLLCYGCDHQRALGCNHPKLKANGGEGLVITLHGINALIKMKGGCVPMPKTATKCEGRAHAPRSDQPPTL